MRQGPPRRDRYRPCVPVRVETSVGLEAIERVSELLQRVHIEHPAAGAWEAADFQWWWRRGS